MSDPLLQSKLIEFKGATLPVMTAHLRDTDAVRLADALHMMLGGMPDFFAGEPAILDLAGLTTVPERIDWTALLSMLRRYQVQPVAVRHLPAGLEDGARRAGQGDGEEVGAEQDGAVVATCPLRQVREQRPRGDEDAADAAQQADHADLVRRRAAAIRAGASRRVAATRRRSGARRRCSRLIASGSGVAGSSTRVSASR